MSVVTVRSPAVGINPGDTPICYCGPFAIFRTAGPGCEHYATDPDSGLVLYGHHGLIELLELIAAINRGNS